MKNKFCANTIQGIKESRGKKFELDNFYVHWKKIKDETGTGIIEVFKQEFGSPNFYEMKRSKLSEKIHTAAEIKIVLEGSDKVDILNQEQIVAFLAYIQSLKKIVSSESRSQLIAIEKKLMFASQVEIRRDTLLLLLVLTQHQFGGRKIQGLPP